MGTGSAKIYDTFLRKASRVRWPSTRIRKLTPAIGAMNSGRVRGIGVTATSAGTTPTTSGAECTYRTQAPISADRSHRDICRDYPDNKWCRMHISYSGSDLGGGWHEERKDGDEGGEEEKGRRNGEKRLRRQADGDEEE